MKTTFTLFIFLLISIRFSFALPNELYVSYKIKEGEKMREIAERFHTSIEKLTATNRQWQYDGIQFGSLIRIPIDHIKKVTIGDEISENQILFENATPIAIEENNQKVVDANTKKGEINHEQFYVDVNRVRNLLSSIKKSNSIPELSIIFSDGSATSITASIDQINVLSSLQRNNFITHNINQIFDHK